MAGSNWHLIKEAPRGAGDFLLRCGSSPIDPVFVGRQDPDNGLWYFGNVEVKPIYFALIPPFDEDGASV
jgi:hypothetical protein